MESDLPCPSTHTSGWGVIPKRPRRSGTVGGVGQKYVVPVTTRREECRQKREESLLPRGLLGRFHQVTARETDGLYLVLEKRLVPQFPIYLLTSPHCGVEAGGKKSGWWVSFLTYDLKR